VEVSLEALAVFFGDTLVHLNERQRRVVAGSMAKALGRGGKSAVAVASGMSRNTVIKAEREVLDGIEPSGRLRAPGAGTKSAAERQPGLLEALDELVHPETRDNPMSLLRWTSKSTANLSRIWCGRASRSPTTRWDGSSRSWATRCSLRPRSRKAPPILTVTASSGTCTAKPRSSWLQGSR
jgi:hypothetical protein